MDKTYIRVLFHLKPKNPILVAGLPSVGNVGIIAVRFLVDSLQAEKCAELYSPVLPDYVTVDDDGLCSLLKYVFFTMDVSEEKSLLMLIGNSQPPAEDSKAYYEICGEILDFMESLNCSLIVSLDGLPSFHTRRAVYVAGTSRRIISEYTMRGMEIYAGGRIIGLPGLLLGLAKIRGIEGICLLSPVTDIVSDRDAAFNIYKFLRKILGLNIADKNMLLGF